MKRIYPKNFFWFFYHLYVEVYHHQLLITANENALKRFFGAGVDFLMGHVGRDINEIPRTSLVKKLTGNRKSEQPSFSETSEILRGKRRIPIMDGRAFGEFFS